MKKINNLSVKQEDRIVCVTVTGAHKIYYQPSRSKERIYLFSTDSLTIKEIYEDRKMYRNPKIGKIFDRIPGMVDYVLRDNNEDKEQDKHNRVKNSDKVIFEDRELAA